MNSFISDYISIVADSIDNDWQDNYDAYRFGPEAPKVAPTPEASLRSIPRKLLKMGGLVTAGSVQQEHNQTRQEFKTAAQYYVTHLQDLEWLYTQLSDQESRQILCSVLAFRAMGYRKIKLPLNTPDYWRQIRNIENLARNKESIDLGFLDFIAYKMSLDSVGYPIELFILQKTPSQILCSNNISAIHHRMLSRLNQEMWFWIVEDVTVIRRYTLRTKLGKKDRFIHSNLCQTI